MLRGVRERDLTKPQYSPLLYFGQLATIKGHKLNQHIDLIIHTKL